MVGTDELVAGPRPRVHDTVCFSTGAPHVRLTTNETVTGVEFAGALVVVSPGRTLTATSATFDGTGGINGPGSLATTSLTVPPTGRGVIGAGALVDAYASHVEGTVTLRRASTWRSRTALDLQGPTAAIDDGRRAR